MIVGLELRQPLLTNKVLLPGIIGVAMGAGYTLSRFSGAGLTAAGALALAGLISSTNLLAHHNKMEDYPAAFAIADREGFIDAPVIACNHFMAAAIWETRRDAQIYLYRQGEVMDFKGPEYFRAMGMSMSKVRLSTLSEIDDYLGGGWIIPGGLEAVLADEDQAVFVRPFCPNNKDGEIEQGILAQGFELHVEALVRGRAPDKTILETPQTTIGLYERR